MSDAKNPWLIIMERNQKIRKLYQVIFGLMLLCMILFDCLITLAIGGR